MNPSRRAEKALQPINVVSKDLHQDQGPSPTTVVPARGTQDSQLAADFARTAIYDAITEERHRQDAQWGGPDHDDDLTPWTWAEVLDKHVGRLFKVSQTENLARDERWAQLIKIAALAIAALEAEDRRGKEGV